MARPSCRRPPSSCAAGVEIEKVVVHHAGADVGQGAHTVFAQIAAETLQVPLEKIELVVSDTAYTGNSGSASASRMTFMAGNAIKGAAELAQERWQRRGTPGRRDLPVPAAADHAARSRRPANRNRILLMVTWPKRLRPKWILKPARST